MWMRYFIRRFLIKCLFLMGMLLFARVFPLIPLFDIKEGMVARDEIKIGRAKVPASIRE